jgi:transposase
MTKFKPINRDTPYLLPPSLQDWLPDEHLARFVVDIVDRMDLKALTGKYQGRGSDAYHPALLLSLLIYGYATGVYSSRRLQQATFDSVAFRYIAADQHPDHDTISTFRQRFLPQLQALFVQVLVLAGELKVLQLGKISLDGTKVQANASKHSALSYGHALKQEEQLRAEVAELFHLAEEADAQEIPTGMNVPEELARRELRLKAIEAAQAKIEARAQERHAQERAQHQQKMAQRHAKEHATGKKISGPAPRAPQAGPGPTDQINLTDEQSRLLPSAGGGFVQGYNAQLAVDVDSLLIVGRDVVQAANDRQQVKPMIEQLQTLPKTLGAVDTLIADTGYFSASNVDACVQASIAPLIATGREAHGRSLWAPDPPVESEPATNVDRMRRRLRSKEGRALYAKRKCTVEPVIGIIKSVMRFRQFLLRGLHKVQGEWNLVTMAWNIKRMFVLQAIKKELQAQPA